MSRSFHDDLETTPSMHTSHAVDADSDEGRSLDSIEIFTSRYGLSHKQETFQRAAALLQNDLDEQRTPDISHTELNALRQESSHKWQQPRALYFTILICALGAVEQGWAQTSMNGANPYIAETFRLNVNHGTVGYVKLGWINCAMYLSNALGGSWLSDPINKLVGRRGAIFVGTMFCLIGNAGAAFIGFYTPEPGWVPRPWWVELFLLRLILGVGLGINASTVSVFAAESAPAYIRGGLAVSWQMFVAFGIFIGFVANLVLFYVGRDPWYRTHLVWRLQLAAPVIPAIPLCLLVFRCPESPSWYIKRARYDRAFYSLCRLRNTELQAAHELYSTYLIRHGDAISTRGTFMSYCRSFVKSFKSLFTITRNRHALLASYTVMISQQLCGINIIAFYSTTIFSGPGHSIASAFWASVLFGLVNFLGAFPAIWTMDSFGRRRLLLWTLPTMALTMAFMAMSFSVPSGENSVHFIILAGLIYLFCALYSPGMGPVPCAYSAEVYPLSVREVGMSLAISTANLWAMVLSLTFPILLNMWGEQRVFALYAVLNGLAWTLCWLFVRETKGVNLEEMDAVFESSPLMFIREKWAERLGADGAERAHVNGWKKVRQDDSEDTRHVE